MRSLALEWDGGTRGPLVCLLLYPVHEVEGLDFLSVPTMMCFVGVQAQSNRTEQRSPPYDELLSSAIRYCEEKLTDTPFVSKAEHGACSYGVCSQARIRDKD